MPKPSANPTLQPRTVSWKAFKPNDFLDAYRKTGCMSKACRKIGCSPSSVAQHRKTNPEFATALDDIIADKVNQLESTVFDHAINGTPEPIHYKGVVFDYVHKYSPHLQMFLLKAHKPKTYAVPEVNSVATHEEQAQAIAMFQRMAHKTTHIAPGDDGAN